MAEETTTGIEGTPEVNQEFLSQSTDIGGVLNPTSFQSTPFVLPKISPAVATSVPASYASRPTITDPPKVEQEESPLNKLMRGVDGLAKSAQDKYKYGRSWAYDADYTGQFYDRYMNMGSLSKKLGFSPWRDNDKIYNASSSWLDNYTRSMRNSMSLANISFKGSLPWNAWSSEVSLEDAENQERAFAEGQDSRGTIGASVNNLFLNTGFTVGVLGELAAESAVIWGAGLLMAPLTGGGSLAGSGAVEVAEVGAATKKIFDVAKMTQRLNQMRNALKDAQFARDFYGYVKSGKPLTQLGKALTPNTVDYFVEMGKLSKTGEQLSNLAKVSKGVGAFYRDVQMVNGALSESKMEAGSVELELRDKIRDQFYAENNRMPSPEEYEKIYAQARAGADETFWMNLPAIYFSNKIVFDKAFSSFKPLRSSREALSQGLRNWALKEGEAGLWEPVKTGMRADIQAMFKGNTWKPKNLTKNMIGKILTYSKANITEGLQEQYQEGVSGAMKEYYQDTFFNPALIGQKASYLGKNMGQQFTTAQGWETFASGFLTGGIIQGPQHIVFTKGAELAERIVDPKGYAQARAAEKKQVQQYANALNDLIKFSKETTKNADENAAVQLRNAEYLRTAAETNDKKSYIDIVGDSMANHLYTLAKGKKLSLFRDSLSDLSSMTSQELVEAYGNPEADVEKSAQKHRDTLTGMLQMSKDVEESYKEVNEALVNPFNPWRYNKDKNPLEFAKEASAYEAFETAKKYAIMSRVHFDNVAKRMESLYQKAGTTKPLESADAFDFQILFSPTSVGETTLSNLDKEIKAMENIPGSDKKLLKEKKKRKEILEALLDAQFEFSEALRQHANFDPKSKDEKDKVIAQFSMGVGSTVTHKDKDGKTKTFRIAKVKKTVVYDENGKSYPKKSVKLKDVGDVLGGINAIVQSKAEHLFDRYSDYVRGIAGLKKDVVFDSKLESGFRDYLDFLRLDPEKQALAKAVSDLSNPDNIKELMEASFRAQDMVDAERVALLENALQEYRKKHIKNKFLNQLLDEGMFIDEKSFDILSQGKLAGVILRHAEAPFGVVSSASENEKYKKGIAILNQWLEAEGFVQAEEKKEEPVSTETVNTPPAGPEATTTPIAQTEEDKKLQELYSKLDALEAKYIKEGKTEQEAASLALNSIPEEERALLKKGYEEDKAKEKQAAETKKVKDAMDTKALIALGYSIPEIESFDADVVDDILLRKLKKKDREIELAEGQAKQKTAEEKAKKKEIVAIKNAFLKELNETGEEEIFEIEERIREWIVENPKDTEEEAKELLAAVYAKKQDLNTLNFQGLNNGDYVWYEGEVYVVFGKTKNKLDIRSVKGAPAKVASVTAEEVPDKLKKFKKKMDTKPTVSPEAQQVANQNVINKENISAEEKKAIFADGEKLASDPKIQDDFDNSLGCE